MSKKVSSAEKNLRAIVRKAVVQQIKESSLKENVTDKQLPMHVLVNKITKSAGDGIKSLENLKNKEMPTQKAMDAIASSIQALEHIFNDMLRNPTAYLDQGNPDEIVASHRQRLDNIESSITSTSEPETSF